MERDSKRRKKCIDCRSIFSRNRRQLRTMWSINVGPGLAGPVVVEDLEFKLCGRPLRVRCQWYCKICHVENKATNQKSKCSLFRVEGLGS